MALLTAEHVETTKEEARTGAPSLFGLKTILFVSLFLQRIAYNAGTLPLPVSLAVSPLVILTQFFSGLSKVSLTRLALFALLAASSTVSMAAADIKSSPTSGLLYTFLYGCFIFCVPVDREEQHRVYRTIVKFGVILSLVGAAQYGLQFVFNFPYLFSWQGLIPASFLIEYNTLNELTLGGGVYKANGFFLLEASALSQLLGRAVLIAVILLKDLRYLPLLGVGMLLTFSGTGMLLVLFFGSIPLVILVFKDKRYRWTLIAAPVLALAVIIGAWDTLNLDLYLARTGEFTDPSASGYARFTGNAFLFLLFAESDPFHFFFGSGPGMAEFLMRQSDAESFAAGWIKLVTEYGIVGLVAFIAFFYTCSFQATRSHLLSVAFIAQWLVLDGNLLVPQHLFVAYAMCGFVQVNSAEYSKLGVAERERTTPRPKAGSRLRKRQQTG